MQLVDVLNSFRRHWRVSLALVLLVAIGLGLFMFTSSEARGPDRWKASVQVLVPYRDEKGVAPEGVPPLLLQGNTTRALSPATTGQALEASGLDESARKHVLFEFEPSERGDILTLSVTARTRDEAQTVAENYANAFMAARRDAVAESAEQSRAGARASIERLRSRLVEVENQLRSRAPDLLARLPGPADPNGDPEASSLASVDGLSNQPLEVHLLVYERQGLLDRIAAARLAYAQNSSEVIVPSAHASIVERLTPRQITPEGLSPVVPIGVALGVAVALALGVPVLLDRIDNSIRDSTAASSALAAPVLSTVPVPSSGEVTLALPGSPGSQAYRTLAAASIATDELPRAIVVTAPVGRVQDAVAANFAAALADHGLRVALVATDSGQAWYGNAPTGTPTLPDFLSLAHAGRLNGQVPDHLLPTPVDNLRVLPAGETGADALIDGLPPLLRAFADADVDVTVIAGPSILEDPIATILAWSTRSVLWVVQTGDVTEQQASEAAARLELAGASPFGIALVDRNG